MRRLMILSIVFLTFSCSQNRYTSENISEEKYLDTAALKSAGLERYILQSSELDLIEKKIGEENGVKVRRMESLSGVVAYLSSQGAQNLQKKLSQLKVMKDIEMQAVPDDLASINARPGSGGGTSPAQVIPWGITKIKAIEAHATSKGAGVKVCIVDTGIDATHPDLKNNISGGKNFVISKGKIDPNRWNDDNGHGSHVAGTVAAEDNSIGVIGAAPLAKLLAIKVLDSRGSGYLSDVADGVAACVAAGSHVINMSLGSNGDPNADSPLKTAITNALNAGVKVVVAAGNEGADISTKIPSGYPGVIAVAAIDSSGQYPSWSNFGLGDNDYTAPGVSINSTWKSGGYNTISGTSMASPHVAGVVALQISASAAALVAIDLGFPMAKQGLGLIDAAASVQ